MDQCKNCIMRGNFDGCIATPCSHRDTWIFREAVEQAHMKGQIDALQGMFDPIYSIATRYFDETYGLVNKHDYAQELYDAAVGLLNRLEADKDVITKDWWASERNKLATAIIKIRGE